VKRIPVAAALIVLLSLTPTHAQKKKTDKRRLAAMTAKEADADFRFQGEYVGELGGDEKAKIGLQVIARGDGKFDAVAYHGGLPGAGWDGKDKIKVTGKRDGDSVTLTSDRGTGVIKNGVISIKNNDGADLGTLKKTARKSPTLGQKPPAGAIALFDGKSVKNWQNGKMTKDGLLIQGTTSKPKFQSFTLHVEFQLSYMPYARGQGRSNSGVYMQGRYEVQVLDSFGLEGKNNECGGIYEVKDPSVNMCLPPLQWQTYDVDFTAAKYDAAGKKTANARMTVRHNGVVVQKDVDVPKATRAAPVKEGPQPGPIYIQNHGNPLRYRNIWIVAKK
jgi:3-keto-disaccharide hydrolase